MWTAALQRWPSFAPVHLHTGVVALQFGHCLAAGLVTGQIHRRFLDDQRPGFPVWAQAPTEFACQRDEETNTAPLNREKPDYSSLETEEALDLALEHLDWRQVAIVVRQAKEEGNTTLSNCMQKAWSGLRAREEKLWWFDGARHTYEVLFPLVGSSERWDAVKTLMLGGDFLSVEGRIHTIQENLDASYREIPSDHECRERR